MNSMVNSAKILVYVTHSMPQAVAMCNRCIWLERGCILMDGNPKEVTEAYMASIKGQ